jgi:hypothetical protein
MKIFSRVYADLITPRDFWPDLGPDSGNPESGNFFDLIEPIHLIIGGIVLVLIIVSLFMIFKSKKK